MFLIVISPAHRRGERICGQFVARLDGRRLCVSPEPLLARARVLLAEGVDPPVAIRHTGADSDAMISTVGVAAALTVREGNKAGPTLVRWKAFCRARIKAPMRQNRRLVPDHVCWCSGPSETEVEAVAEKHAHRGLSPLLLRDEPCTRCGEPKPPFDGRVICVRCAPVLCGCRGTERGQ